MDKELDNIADDIIKDSFGSAAPAVPEVPKTPEAPAQGSLPKEPVRTNGVLSGDPFLNRPPRSSAPVTPRETFTAEVPKRELPKRPLGNVPVERVNEYNRIKEQMSAAREASGMNNPIQAPDAVPSNEKPKGLNKIVLVFVILIPVIVVVAGVVIMLLNQPNSSTSDNGQGSTNQQTKYVDPREDAEQIDLTTYTSEIQIDKAGHYILSGTTIFPIKVNADGEVTLYLHNISVTATDSSALSNFSTNHLVIYMDDDTENTLAVTDSNTFDSIYSEGDLTIDGGTGILNVTGIKITDGHHYDVTGNGIKDTKNVVITPSDSSENPNGSENPENPDVQDSAEDSIINQPAEGESDHQSTQPADPSSNL